MFRGVAWRGVSRGMQASRTRLSTTVSATPQPAASPTRLFTQFSLYKGKAAVAFKPVAPRLVSAGTGSTLERQGGVLIEIGKPRSHLMIVTCVRSAIRWSKNI